jgi:hypothetical protein
MRVVFLCDGTFKLLKFLGLFTLEIGCFDEIGFSEPHIWMVLDDMGSKSLKLYKTDWTQIRRYQGWKIISD